MKPALVSLMLLFCGTAAHAEMNIDAMNTGTGLAQIMAREAKCGYKIDAKALGDYMKHEKLDAPDILAWISNQKQYQESLVSNLTDAECAATAAAARGAGITP